MNSLLVPFSVTNFQRG